jgi:subtilisin family serine protease
MAPGSDIRSTIPPGGGSATGILGGPSAGKVLYGSLTGTSMATPHVAGVVALMLQANPGLAPQDVKKILLVTAQDLGGRGPDNETGYGFVNAIAAVQVAKDPTLLDQPQFASILASIPDPPKESVFESFSQDIQAMVRDGGLPTLLSLAAGVAGVIILGIVVAKRRR